MNTGSDDDDVMEPKEVGASASIIARAGRALLLNILGEGNGLERSRGASMSNPRIFGGSVRTFPLLGRNQHLTRPLWEVSKQLLGRQLIVPVSSSTSFPSSFAPFAIPSASTANS